MDLKLGLYECLQPNKPIKAMSKSLARLPLNIA
jgi:hypothetical protein